MDKRGGDEEIHPYRIAVPDEVLGNLRLRLSMTRWPDAEPVSDWSQGIPLQYMQEICHYWQHDYEWRVREALLNRFSQFVTEIDGLDIHFIHQRSPHPHATPLLITHGWPGSIVEFHNVIDPLVDPVAFGGKAEDAFDVVAPSLPGFGFSGKPTETGWGVERIAAAWAALMERLGYPRYLAQGGDWGALVTTAVGSLDPGHCIGVHTTLASVPPNIGPEGPTPEEAAALKQLGDYQEWEAGYSKQQSTRPQTLGYGLTDSPVGQAAWILEKFQSWMDCQTGPGQPGHPENVLSRDELLDNIMLYWATGSATSSARLYWESFGKGERFMVDVPSGFAVFPKEIIPPVRKWLDADLSPTGTHSNIVHWAEYDRGGHFAALELPDLFVEEVRSFARVIDGRDSGS